MYLRSGKAARWIRAGCVLDILAMLGNQGWAKFCEFLSKLWEDLGTDEVLHGCLGAGIRVDIYFELRKLVVLGKGDYGRRGDVQHTRFLQYHAQPQGL